MPRFIQKFRLLQSIPASPFSSFQFLSYAFIILFSAVFLATACGRIPTAPTSPSSYKLQFHFKFTFIWYTARTSFEILVSHNRSYYERTCIDRHRKPPLLPTANTDARGIKFQSLVFPGADGNIVKSKCKNGQVVTQLSNMQTWEVSDVIIILSSSSLPTGIRRTFIYGVRTTYNILIPNGTPDKINFYGCIFSKFASYHRL